MAFDAAGKPTKAALGFAKSQGIGVEALSVFPTDRGEYVGFVREEAARAAQEVLPKIVSDFIPSIPFKKSMRWADLDVRFARPVHWIVSLYGEEVIPFRFGNIDAGRTTYGHRFLSPGPIELPSPDAYEGKLAEAHVLVDLEARKERIRAGLRELAGRTGMKWVEDEPLVETVANLVEFPVVMQGRFEEKYLALPREILVTSMRNNQKYFVFEDDRGALRPAFAFVSNMVVPDERVVVAGNERVLRSRLVGRGILLLGRPEDAAVRPDRGAEEGPVPGRHGDLLGEDGADGGHRLLRGLLRVPRQGARIAAGRPS